MRWLAFCGSSVAWVKPVAGGDARLQRIQPKLLLEKTLFAAQMPLSR